VLGLLPGELRLLQGELLLQEGEAACEPGLEAFFLGPVPLLGYPVRLFRCFHPLQEGGQLSVPGLQSYP